MDVTHVSTTLLFQLEKTLIDVVTESEIICSDEDKKMLDLLQALSFEDIINNDVMIEKFHFNQEHFSMESWKTFITGEDNDISPLTSLIFSIAALMFYIQINYTGPHSPISQEWMQLPGSLEDAPVARIPSIVLTLLDNTDYSTLESIHPTLWHARAVRIAAIPHHRSTDFHYLLGLVIEEEPALKAIALTEGLASRVAYPHMLHLELSFLRLQASLDPTPQQGELGVQVELVGTEHGLDVEITGDIDLPPLPPPLTAVSLPVEHRELEQAGYMPVLLAEAARLARSGATTSISIHQLTALMQRAAAAAHDTQTCWAQATALCWAQTVKSTSSMLEPAVIVLSKLQALYSMTPADPKLVAWFQSPLAGWPRLLLMYLVGGHFSALGLGEMATDALMAAGSFGEAAEALIIGKQRGQAAELCHAVIARLEALPGVLDGTNPSADRYKSELCLCHCVLAELTDDPEGMRRAWKLSRGTMGRAQRDLARHLEGHKNMEAAIESWRNALSADAGDARSVEGLGRCLTHVGGKKRLKEAERCFEKLISMDPNNGVHNANLGSVRMMQKRYKQAAAAFASALERMNDWSVATSLLQACSAAGEGGGRAARAATVLVQQFDRFTDEKSMSAAAKQVTPFLMAALELVPASNRPLVQSLCRSILELASKMEATSPRYCGVLRTGVAQTLREEEK
eukprot:gnl/Dysnectes_brevis/756_a831_1480.p1 GENE.gnl/Dysnectes_brevis/756_a831_1480~~gnl/Dysnectes_brevis/756_a831_1480.p1  ORF type:complete len:686 (+),score=263.57 gnl/Dysnectes_brevis/756_a831_1480:70-2127(+)